MIDFKCLNCGRSLTTKDEHAGRSTKCPSCGHQVRIPMEFTGTGGDFDDFDDGEVVDDDLAIRHESELEPSFGERSRSLGSELKEELWQKSGMPRDIEELISASETVLYSGNPARSALILKLIGAFLSGLAAGLPLRLYGAIFTVPLALYLAYIDWKHQFYVITTRRVITRSGWFNRRISLAPTHNIQSVSVNTGFIDRWLKLNTVHFFTAASLGFLSPATMKFKNVDSSVVLRAFGTSLSGDDEPRR
jgi:membrane protein YdbS with pleckstrin-like domain/DNA-directed RNA polymerase subunit RPC12/RpoP